MRNIGLILSVGLSIIAAFGAVLGLSVWLAHRLAAGPSEVTGWVQAIGSIMAIVAGFGVAAYQVQKQREDTRAETRERAQAAHKLAFQAYRLIGERLQTALSPKEAGGRFDLKGYRATEMVAAMREFDTGRLPTPLIEPFIELRTRVFAINERIGQLYSREDSQSPADRAAAKALRYGKLESAVRVYARAGEIYAELDAAAKDNFSIPSLNCDVPPAIAGYAAPGGDRTPA